MERSFLAAPLALLFGATIVHAEEPAPAARRVVTFEDARVGSPPAGFTTALTGGGGPVTWVVQEDAPSGKRVLVQTSADKTDKRFPLCIDDAISSADVTLSVKFKPISGTVDQAGGLVWRYQDPSNYYLVRANALEGNVVLYKVENGKRSDLTPIGSGLFSYGRKATVEARKWQILGVSVRGARFSVSLNGEHLFDVEDSTFQAPGKAGLWTKADSVTAFDDLTIEPSPPSVEP
jgi:hypothetical protein